MSFDRMRSMLMRAAEIRDSEQQQIFDSLDEIHARLATLDALGSMRKRLAELPDRTEVSVLAERLDETVAKLDAQDAAVASVGRSVDALVDRLAKPFAQLDGRLDGVAGRMEGIAGRMEGLDDKLGGLHKRLDDLDNRLDRHELRLDGMPGAITGPVKERLSSAETTLRGRLDEVDDAARADRRDQLRAAREAHRTRSAPGRRPHRAPHHAGRPDRHAGRAARGGHQAARRAGPHGGQPTGHRLADHPGPRGQPGLRAA
jgi:chromosome segregation ATPase